jgi:hypothetical protein
MEVIEIKEDYGVLRHELETYKKKGKISHPLRGGDNGEGESIQSPPPNLPPQGGGTIRETK